MAAGAAASPLEAIASARMGWRQYMIVALCCLTNVTEGFDVVSLAYAAPVMTREWGTPAAMLGLVFSFVSVGLAIGAFFTPALTERIGRRWAIIAATVIIIISHGLSAINDSIYNLMVLRFGMGIGLGVILVSLNVMVSEFSNDKNRSFAIAMLHSGFSVGMMLGGGLAALVLEPLGWRYVFWLGVLINTSLLFLLIFFLMESPTFLITRQPRNALARLNTMLKQLGHQALEAMPLKPSAAANGGGGFKAMLEGRMASASIMLWAASLTYAVVGYFLLNWKPSVLVDAGLTPTQASLGGVFEGFLGIAGHLIVGLLARKGAEARVTAAFFAMLGVFLVIFGNITAEWWVMIGISGMLKFFTVGAYTGIFLVVIAMYEPAVRSMGLGFMVGFGRVGAIIGPLIGGLLIGADIGRPATFAVFAVVAVVPAVLIVLVGRQNAARQAPLKEAAA